MPKAKAENSNSELTGKGGKKKIDRKEHERWYMDGHSSVMKKVQLLVKACLSSVVNVMEPILKQP